jgi:hypothetical protein
MFNFTKALALTGVCMAGIFFFMIVFWGIIVFLHKKFPGEDSKA